jgi:uncharacterized damage-inducible protein DinB
MAPSQLQRMFEHHAWATKTLIDFCAELGEQQTLSLAGTPGTIARTLTHMVSSEQLYLEAVTGKEPAAWLEELIVPVADLVDRAVENAERWWAYLEAGYDPDQVVSDPRDSARHFVLWERIAQTLAHGAEHRTHACSILGANGIEPPDLSLGAFGNLMRRR